MDKIAPSSQRLTIVWSDNARIDLKDIVLYLKKYSVEAASKFVAHLRKRLSHLESNPSLGRRLPEFPDLPFREIIIEKYCLIYERRDDAIEILTIIHSRRDSRELF